MTVFGGLQCNQQRRSSLEEGRFNTDDGIWRATIFVLFISQKKRDVVSIPMTVFGGLQLERSTLLLAMPTRFNTDDGIWRATIRNCLDSSAQAVRVSIPMTVFGGLQSGFFVCLSWTYR